MKTPELYFQKIFSTPKRNELNCKFLIDSDETIFFAFWTDCFASKGFVFTDKKLYFNLPSMTKNQENEEAFENQKNFLEIESETPDSINF